MFEDATLKNHLETTSVIKNRSLVLAEWNLNRADNIAAVGNYRYRPAERFLLPLNERSVYASLNNSYDYNDEGNFYTGATDADVVVDGGFEETGVPAFFTTTKQKESLLYSLEDCLGRFRPRSGINKLRYFDGKFAHHSNVDMALRPRYYLSDKNDKFKYWSSYRTDAQVTTDPSGTRSSLLVERGIANQPVQGSYYIDDAAPFVVYKKPVPANRIVVKMQTNVGTIDLGPFSSAAGSFEDPLFGDQNKTTPARWSVQYLKNNIWTDAIRFSEFDTRENGLPIINPDGYVEVAYGLLVPERYRATFFKAGELFSEDLLPETAVNGEAYLVRPSSSVLGTYYVWFEGEFQTFTPTFGWYLHEEKVTGLTAFAQTLSNPPRYFNAATGQEAYQEFEFIDGIRIVVETMNKADSTFELIEMSPRLVADLSDKTSGFSIKKPASDLGVSGMPVGQLLAGTGNISLFDYDQSFFKSNVWNSEEKTGSIIAEFASQNLQIKMYEVISDVEGYDYYVPLKTMYSEGFPEISNSDRQVSLTLRDLYFYFESVIAPQTLITNASLSYAVSLLLDSIGFSNYSFKRLDSENDPIIPFFFIPPDKSVAEVLSDLAISTQSTMFFDEYNNFIVMSKNYILPSEDERETNIVLYGSRDFEKDGAYQNKKIGAESTPLANIISISSQPNQVYNDGSINYTTRYIQRSYGKLSQGSLINRDKTWIYKPVLLWEVAGTESVRSTNDQSSTSTNFALSAIPLNSDLSADLPQVINNRVINNTIDLGEGVYWLGRYNGYFYANGEIIKFDAVQYSIPGLVSSDETEDGNLVWITSAQQYQRYFAKLPFNGKIYPTGLVRIYSEPNYETVNGVTRLINGVVAKHGRGQFGTSPVAHTAGLSAHWSNNDNVRGCNMQSRYLFGSSYIGSTSDGPAGKTLGRRLSNDAAKQTTRNGIIKNFLSSSFVRESDANRLYSTQTGTIQSSALIMSGLTFANDERPIDFISYVSKKLDQSYKHFGTRMRIVGRIKNDNTRFQSPSGSVNYYTLPGKTPQENVSIGGSSGGIGVMVDPETNNGYYFEIVALTENNIDSYQKNSTIFNILFYKIVSDVAYDIQLNTNLSGLYDGQTLKSVNPGQLVINSAVPNIDDRIWIRNQANPVQNGFYIVTNNGSSTQNWVLTRSEPGNAIPIRLWGGLTNIAVDDGNFTGQYRIAGEEITTVYDLAVEYENIGNSRKFYLYINNRLVQTVVDPNPLPVYNNLALFVRGNARCMFENVYAITGNYSNSPGSSLELPASSAFTNNELSVSDSFRKYAVSGVVQSTYLSGIATNQPPAYKMYFEEFGTIMREAAYLNVRYDKAYPALYAQLSPTFNRIKGYTVSGFTAGSYGAEFLLFNATDTVLNLDETSGNYLRIQGITFTQESETELTVDDYFSKRSDLSNPQIKENTLIESPVKVKQEFLDIKTSRLTYGKKEFSLSTPYVQTYDDANELMGWMIKKIMKPRMAVGVEIFSNPIIQLGDIVTINYKNSDGIDEIASPDTRFVVYNIEYDRTENGPKTTLYLSEVV